MTPLRPLLDSLPELTLDGLVRRVRSFQGRRLLVVGDLMLDEYLWGEVSRVSPEAPVPVVEAKGHRFDLGGAANVVNNVRTLGGDVIVVGLVGADPQGDTLLDALYQAGVCTDGVVRDPDRPTTSKLRIVAHSQQTDQQIVRIDRESRARASESRARDMLARALDRLDEVDALLLSDYNKGVLVPGLSLPLLAASRERDIPSVANPKPSNLHAMMGCGLVSMNLHEALAALQAFDPAAWGGSRSADLDGGALLDGAAASLREQCACSALFITRSARGMACATSEGVRHLPPIPAAVYDGTGAGDTVISVSALTLACGGSAIEAAALGNAGGSLQVHKPGAAGIRMNELIDYMTEGTVEPNPRR